MRYFLLILLLFSIISTRSQIRLSNKEDSLKNYKGLYTSSCGLVEKDPLVDIKHWQYYLTQNLDLDFLAMDSIPEGIYRLTAQILIGKNGCIEQVRILGDPGVGLSDKVIKVISSYQQWVPAERNGRQVRAYRKQPITFIVEKDECERNLRRESVL